MEEGGHQQCLNAKAQYDSSLKGSPAFQLCIYKSAGRNMHVNQPERFFFFFFLAE